MFIRDGKYYFMWSEGGWGGPHYRVAYAIADSPFGPFERKGVILQQDPEVATGAGHHSVLHNPKSDKYYIVYHRRPLGSNDGNNRETCIDLLEFDEQGNIKVDESGMPTVPNPTIDEKCEVIQRDIIEIVDGVETVTGIEYYMVYRRKINPYQLYYRWMNTYKFLPAGFAG